MTSEECEGKGTGKRLPKQTFYGFDPMTGGTK
jgi:hypothetical protein